MKTHKDSTQEIDLGELTSRLKNKDQGYGNLAKRLQYVYWAFLPISIVLLLISITEGSNVYEIFGSICYFLAFLIFALLFRFYSKEYKHVDYSEPTLVMLKKAADRYKPFRSKSYWAILGLFLVVIKPIIDKPITQESTFDLLISLGLFVLAVLVGMIAWTIRDKALRDHILVMIKDLEE